MYTEIFASGPLNSGPAAAAPSSPNGLYAALLNNSGSGTVEIHALSRQSNFSQFMVHSTSAFAPAAAPDWQFFVGGYHGDGQPDLYGVHLRNTGSRKVEVHALSAGSGYQSWIVHAATPMPALPSGRYQLAMSSLGGDHRSNLYLIAPHTTASNTVEVHALSEASNFTSWAVHSASGFSTVSASGWQFTIGDRAGSGDLVGIAHSATGSGRTEVHALSRTSGYQGWSLHTVTPLGYTTDTQFSYTLNDLDGNGNPDLVALAMNGTASGMTEVHVLSGASAFTGWIDHAATGLGPTTPTSWQFSAY